MVHRTIPSFLALTLGAILCIFALPSTAQTSGGIFWDPDRPGQGMNIILQEDLIYGVWYLYDEDGDALWTTFVAERSNSTVSTDLLSFQGPPLSQPFDGSQVEFVVLGTATIEVISPSKIKFSYAIGDSSGVLNLEPFIFANPDPDRDEDGVPDDEDNCIDIANPDQEDEDEDGVGDACEAEDADDDGVPDGEDNCVDIANPDQEDEDENGVGDACEAEDADDDGVPDFADNCPIKANPEQNDSDGDGDGDACDICENDPDNDLDGDGFCANVDVCPDSDRSGTVVIDQCDSGVSNIILDDGCSIADEIAECASDASNHGQFVSCVSHLSNDLKKDDIIGGRDKGAIQSCAAQADIP